MRALLPLLLLASAARAALPETLSLDEALALARQRQPSLRAARAQADVSTARAREALAPILPTVSLAIGYSQSTGNFAASPGALPSNLNNSAAPTLTFSPYWTSSLGVQATLWDFGQNWNRWQASLSSADAQAAQVHASEVAAALLVRTAFYGALAQRELVEVARATLVNVEAHLAQVQGFVTVGTRPEIDLAQSRADRANARLALVNAKNGYAVARARLNQAIGLEGPSSYEVVGAPAGPLEGEGALAALFDEALAARPEVVALEAQLKAQDLIIRSTWGGYWPTLGLSLGGTARGPALDRLTPNLSGALTLNWQLYSGGVTAAQVVEQQAALTQLEAQRDGLRLQVRLDVEQAELNVAAAREGVEVAGEALEAASERLRLAQGRYTAGAGIALELADAQVSYTNAAAQRVQAVYALATARAQLVAAVGRR